MISFRRAAAGGGFIAAALALTLACGRPKDALPAAGPKAVDVPSPVRVAPVERRTLTAYVTAPGHTAALSQQKVRAPFAGTLVELKAFDGDLVRRGQVVGAVVSRDSEAALSGAREMLRDAKTAAERGDAERAVALAERNIVRRSLFASADGPVLSHAAAAGDRLSEDQEVLTIEDASTVVFLSDVAQTDLARVRPGQAATVELGGGQRPLSGEVRSILPGANAADFTGPVRIDLPPSAGRLALGLFGTARIATAEKKDAIVTPDAAVLRDDVMGTSRVATILRGRIHWVAVQTGLRQDGWTEITAGELTGPVAISGMIGLPEGKSVVAAAP